MILKCGIRTGVRGFTLVEAVVAVGIISMITLGVVTFQKTVITNAKVLQSTMSAQQQVRRTMQIFSAELRSATQSANGSYAIESAGTSSLVFYANIDKDPDVERVRYFYGTSSPGGTFNTLLKGVIEPVGTTYPTANEKISYLVYDMKNSSTSPIFTYYDSTYNGTASSTAPLAMPVSIPSIRLVMMSLGVDPNAARSPTYHTYSTQVSVRNLKDNL